MNQANQSKAFLRCIEAVCRRDYAINERLYTCPSCGGLLDVAYDFQLQATAAEMKVLFKTRKASEIDLDRSGVWRFRELLPFIDDFASVVTLAEGNTPIYTAPRSADYAEIESLRFKHQGMNPTGSFKDNGMTTGVSQAARVGAKAVACASTGNTSASMAAYGARAGMRSVVFIPAGEVAWGKLSQALEYGAMVVELEGSFDDAMRVVREVAAEADLYLLNSINPFRLEGQKTIIIELVEQCSWQPPDWIVLPGGNLGNVSAFGKALHELAELGFIDRVPRLAVIQAEGAAPFYDLFTASTGSQLKPVEKASTLATAIKIGNPVSWKKALRALEWTDGVVERVSEQEIADAKAIIGRDGIGCEPASAATLAGIKRLAGSGVIASGNDVLAVLTGNLLKDPNYTVDYHTGKLGIGAGDQRRAIDGRFANRPMRAAADRDEIKRVLGLS
jgi:threonine synthase